MPTLRRPLVGRIQVLFSAAICTVCLVLITVRANGQATTGITAFSPYQLSQYDYINLSNLDILLRFPIKAKSGLAPFSLAFAGDSSISKFGSIWRPNAQFIGPQSLLKSGISFSTRTSTCPGTSTQTTIYNRWVVTDSIAPALRRAPRTMLPASRSR